MVVLSKTLNFSLCAEMPLDTREFVRNTISPSQRWEQIFVKVKASKGKLLRSLRSWGAKFVTNSTCTKGTATTSRAGRSSPSMRPNHNRVTSPLCLACFYVSQRAYGGFQSHGVYPKSFKSFDHFSIETHGDFWIPYFKKTPYDYRNLRLCLN